ncbi:hypothetical protein R3P38DRAFT_2881543 [Favolaschia claudopus]|uniref:Uncharacterized protein n=1 Tax=Favolaschia claudopus TaxID=2862362 RepID=A0AAW0D1T5_9AGAR
MSLCCHRPLRRWPCRPPRDMTRSLHSSPTLCSTYRGYNMHGTLREWALRMIRKEDVKYAARSDSRRPHKHIPYSEHVKELADRYVHQEIRKKEQRDAPPRGRAARLVRAADKLLAEAGNPFEAKGRKNGARVAADRRGRLREALRLYMRASQRPDGSMPVFGSRIWGTTHFLERRITKTAEKLENAERVTRVHYTPVKEDTVKWGVTAQPRRELDEPLEWVKHESPLSPDLHPTSRGLAYKKEQQLPTLHRLAPSAVQRAKLPLLQAFPGVGHVGGQVLSVGHASYASRGLLGTVVPPNTPSSPSTLSSAPPRIYDTAHPTTFFSLPTVTKQDPFYAPPDPTALRSPPSTRRGKLLRWMRDSKKREHLAMRYFPALAPPPPAPVSEKRVSSATGMVSPFDSPDAEATGARSAFTSMTHTRPELAWVRQPPPRTATPSLAHALRVRLAGRVRLFSAQAGQIGEWR